MAGRQSLVQAPSDFDTKLYVYKNACPGTVDDCNDDACTDAAGDDFRSFLPAVELFAGAEVLHQ